MSPVPFQERGGAVRGVLDLLSGRYPAFVFGGAVDLLPVFHFHDVMEHTLNSKLQYLAENGYRTVTADEICAYVGGTLRLDGRYVGLCFDDAWASLWTVAAPLLKRYGLNAIAYAIPARIEDAPRSRATIDDPEGQNPAGGPPLVTWPELRALHASGLVDVQCHTDTHSMVFCSAEMHGFVTPRYSSTPLLNRPQLHPPPGLRFVAAGDLGAPLPLARSRMSDARRVWIPEEIYTRCVALVHSEGGADFFKRRDWRSQLFRLTAEARTVQETEPEQQRAIEEELDGSRAILRAQLRTEGVNHICLPWGITGVRAAAAVARLGYRTAFANRPRGVLGVSPGDDPRWLKRLPSRYIFFLPGPKRRSWLSAASSWTSPS